MHVLLTFNWLEAFMAHLRLLIQGSEIQLLAFYKSRLDFGFTFIFL